MQFVKFKKLGSDILYHVPIYRYKIDWDTKCRSKFQKQAKDFLYAFWSLDLVCEEFPLIGTRLSLDFINLTEEIAVEVQGRQHNEFVKHFHISELNFGKQIKRDLHKHHWCQHNNIKLIEIHNLKSLSKDFFRKHYNVEL